MATKSVVSVGSLCEGIVETMETTLVMIKPDCVQKRMIGSVIGALENSGMTISNMRLTILSQEEASELYKEHKGKWHFNRNIEHITSDACVVMKVDGENAISRCREFVEDFRQAHQDVVELPRNLIHATLDPDKVYDELSAVGLDSPKKLALEKIKEDIALLKQRSGLNE